MLLAGELAAESAKSRERGLKVVSAQVLSRVVLRVAPGHQVRVVRRSITFAPSGGMPVVVDRLAA